MGDHLGAFERLRYFGRPFMQRRERFSIRTSGLRHFSVGAERPVLFIMVHAVSSVPLTGHDHGRSV